jgi:hypothetical protein
MFLTSVAGGRAARQRRAPPRLSGRKRASVGKVRGAWRGAQKEMSGTKPGLARSACEFLLGSRRHVAHRTHTGQWRGGSARKPSLRNFAQEFLPLFVARRGAGIDRHLSPASSGHNETIRMTTNRRRKRRRAISGEALVCSHEGKPIVGCHLRDVSDSGARIAAGPDELALIPPEFVLILAKRAKVHRRCRVVWRADKELGVRFTAL